MTSSTRPRASMIDVASFIHLVENRRWWASVLTAFVALLVVARACMRCVLDIIVSVTVVDRLEPGPFVSSGIMGSMFCDVVQLFSLQPVFSGSALMAQRVSALAESVAESGLFLRVMEVACEGQRPNVEVAAVADLHAQLMFGMARREAQRPVLASFGQDAAAAVQMYIEVLDR